MRYAKSKIGFAALAALLCFVVSAHADAIDGDWCHSDGRRISIRGPEIVTPGGKRMTGDYSRHAFSYVIPAPETSNGQTMAMTLLDENNVRIRVGTAGDAEAGEIWKRCSASIS